MKVSNKIVSLIVLCVIMFVTTGLSFAQNNLNLKDYHSITIPKGSFLKGTLMSGISSEINQLGDRVWLLNSFNMFIGEANVIPKGSIFEGKISRLQKAIKGQDGILEIEINKIILPSQDEMQIKAMLTQKGAVRIGGAFSKRETYRKMPHFAKGVVGYVQLLPDGERLMGKETKLTTGDEYIIQLVDDINIILKDN